jgi:hypothetical protein
VTTKPATDTAPATIAARSARVIRAASVRLMRIPAQQTARTAMATNFRVPGTADPSVRLRRLAGVTTWAATLGFGGLVLALRIIVGLLTTIATWYLAVMFTLGLIGIACTVGAFASIHRRHLPWALLGGATAAELACFVVTLG